MQYGKQFWTSDKQEYVDVDAPLKEWEGVTVEADGQVVKIDFSRRCMGGA